MLAILLFKYKQANKYASLHRKDQIKRELIMKLSTFTAIILFQVTFYVSADEGMEKSMNMKMNEQS